MIFNLNTNLIIIIIGLILIIFFSIKLIKKIASSIFLILTIILLMGFAFNFGLDVSEKNIYDKYCRNIDDTNQFTFYDIDDKSNLLCVDYNSNIQIPINIDYTNIKINETNEPENNFVCDEITNYCIDIS